MARLEVATHINVISHWFDLVKVQTLDLLYGKPALLLIWWLILVSRFHICRHIRTYIYTYIHITHVICIYMHTWTRTRTHTRSHRSTDTYNDTYTVIQTHGMCPIHYYYYYYRPYAVLLVYTHSHSTHKDTCSHTHIVTYGHIYTHTHVCVYTRPICVMSGAVAAVLLLELHLTSLFVPN